MHGTVVAEGHRKVCGSGWLCGRLDEVPPNTEHGVQLRSKRSTTLSFVASNASNSDGFGGSGFCLAVGNFAEARRKVLRGFGKAVGLI